MINFAFSVNQVLVTVTIESLDGIWVNCGKISDDGIAVVSCPIFRVVLEVPNPLEGLSYKVVILNPEADDDTSLGMGNFAASSSVTLGESFLDEQNPEVTLCLSFDFAGEMDSLQIPVKFKNPD